MYSKFLVVTVFILNSAALSAEEVTRDLAQDDLQQESIYGNSKPLLESELEGAQGAEPTMSSPTTPVGKTEVLKKISELEKLVPFNDVAVIQKRFLPKTNRFEFYPNIGLITNNAFFLTTSFQGRLAYSLTEKWAAEAIIATYASSKYKVTEDLAADTVQTQSLLMVKSYYGLDLRWSPVYGKMGTFSSGILPFDMYFSLGGGVIGSNQDSSPFAIHVGTGQIFALRKWWAFRWDLSGYFYSSETRVAGSGTGTTSQSFTDIQLSLGMSFFFPDAKYR